MVFNAARICELIDKKDNQSGDRKVELILCCNRAEDGEPVVIPPVLLTLTEPLPTEPPPTSAQSAETTSNPTVNAPTECVTISLETPGKTEEQAESKQTGTSIAE